MIIKTYIVHLSTELITMFDELLAAGFTYEWYPLDDEWYEVAVKTFSDVERVRLENIMAWYV